MYTIAQQQKTSSQRSEANLGQWCICGLSFVVDSTRALALPTAKPARNQEAGP